MTMGLSEAQKKHRAAQRAFEKVVDLRKKTGQPMLEEFHKAADRMSDTLADLWRARFSEGKMNAATQAMPRSSKVSKPLRLRGGTAVLYFDRVWWGDIYNVGNTTWKDQPHSDGFRKFVRSLDKSLKLAAEAWPGTKIIVRPRNPKGPKLSAEAKASIQRIMDWEDKSAAPSVTLTGKNGGHEA